MCTWDGDMLVICVHAEKRYGSRSCKGTKSDTRGPSIRLLRKLQVSTGWLQP